MTHPEHTELIVTLPLVPVKRTVVFPDTMVPLTIGRGKSIAAIESAMNTEEKSVLLTAQRDPEKEDSAFQDLYQVGTKAVIKQMGKTSEGYLQVLVQGIKRMVLLKVESADPFFLIRTRSLEHPRNRGRRSKHFIEPCTIC